MGMKLLLESYSETFDIMGKLKMKKYYFLQGLIALLILGLFITFGVFSSGVIENFLISKLDNEGSILYVVVRTVIVVVMILIYAQIYRAVLLGVTSPILGYISEKVDSYLNETQFDFSMKENIKMLVRGVKIGWLSFKIQIVVWIITVIMQMTIFPLAILSIVIIFLVQCYYTGYSFMDYTLERHGFSPEESMDFLKRNKWYSIINGMVFILLMLIPILGVIIAPIFMSILMTVLTLKLIKKEKEGEKICHS